MYNEENFSENISFCDNNLFMNEENQCCFDPNIEVNALISEEEKLRENRIDFINSVNQYKNSIEPSIKISHIEKSTCPITNIQENLSIGQKNNGIINTKIESPFYSLDIIINILTSKNLVDIKNRLIRGKYIENTIEYKHLESGIFIKKRKITNFENWKSYIKKRGRPKKNKVNFIHTNLSPDNIIKKIKAKISIYILNFINSLLNEVFSPDRYKLLKINYYYVNEMKKEVNISHLGMKLKEILSLDISPKYTKLDERNKERYNEELIKEIITQEKLKNDDTISFALGLSLQDFMDIFTYKKTFEDCESEGENIDFQKIKNAFKYCDSLLNEIKINQSSDEYFSFFIFFLYNYKRWFTIKKERIIDESKKTTKKPKRMIICKKE